LPASRSEIASRAIAAAAARQIAGLRHRGIPVGGHRDAEIDVTLSSATT